MIAINSQLKKTLESKLKLLNDARPLSSLAVKKLRDQLKVEMTYNSNAIEGNKLTLRETFLVIKEGLTIKGKSLEDHLEVKNHHEALEFLCDLVEKDKTHLFSENLIRSLHQIVMRETDQEKAGKYRNCNVLIAGAQHTPPEAIEVAPAMRSLVKWFKKKQTGMHPITVAALLHHKLVYIHPFVDGNGRVARLIMNLFLMQKGFPITIVLKNDRKKYYETLSLADKGKLTPFVNFIAQAVHRSLSIYLDVLVPISQKKEKYLTLSEVARYCPYSAKYLNLLARKGKLEAYKKRRNWLTSKAAVQI